MKVCDGELCRCVILQYLSLYESHYVNYSVGLCEVAAGGDFRDRRNAFEPEEAKQGGRVPPEDSGIEERSGS